MDKNVQITFAPREDNRVFIYIADASVTGGRIGVTPWVQEASSHQTYNWSEVKKSMIDASIFSALDGDGLETELKSKLTAQVGTAASWSDVMAVISKLLPMGSA